MSTTLRKKTLMWINHYALLPGDSSVVTSFNAVSSGVGGGLPGLVVRSTTTGQDATGGGIKAVHMALQIPPGFLVNGVRVCYDLSNPRSFVSQIRLSQIQTPPKTALTMLDDGTDQTQRGPICVDSTMTTIDPKDGAILLHLRLNFGNVTDKIVILALGLHLTQA